MTIQFLDRLSRRCRYYSKATFYWCFGPRNRQAHYRLYIRLKSTERFVNLIRPYIHPCFDYKIQNSSGVASELRERGT